jgi:hypothetical protein
VDALVLDIQDKQKRQKVADGIDEIRASEKSIV